MKILPILLLLAPIFMFGQGKVGVGTIEPDHPFQVNVDSIYTDTIADQSMSPGVAISGGLAIVPGSQKGAQRLTVGESGYLSQLKVYFGLPTNANEVLIEVFRGAGPEGELMTSATLLDVIIGARTVNFPQPWGFVTEGEVLNIVMTPITGASCKWKAGLFDAPEFTAFHYTGTWDTILIDLAMTTYITFTDTVIHDVLKVKDDKRVMINDYAFPQYDGNAGEVMSTNGTGSLSWSSPEALNVSVLQDTDHDTKVEVETTPDDDIIRMKVAGQQKLTILPSGKVGLNVLTPVSDLDIRGDNDETDGGELQLATPSMSNFIRMFGGRLGDPHPFIAFSDQDHFHFVTTASDWSTFTRRLTISPSGKVGIGTDQPTALLEVNAGAVLFKGPVAELPFTPADPPASGAGTRMMWYPDKAAFRVGRVVGDTWDKDSIGNYSIAGGFGNKAKGVMSFIGAGEAGTASGTHAFIGSGTDNSASGNYSFIGNGNLNTASGRMSFIGGGEDHHASGEYSFIGSGAGLFARSYGETVFGTYATDYTPASATSFNTDDRLFIIGNGTSTGNRSNALTILKSGSIGVGTSAPENRIHVEGSATSTQHILSVQNNYSGTSHIRAVEAISNPSNGYGIGGHFTGGARGVQGIATVTGSFGGTITGIEGTASGGFGGTRIGVYGTATNGMTNWAGYFANGDVKVENEMWILKNTGIGTSPSYEMLRVEGDPASNETVMRVENNWTGSTNVAALIGVSLAATGYGRGGEFTGGSRGVIGIASGGSSSSTCIGLDGSATGTTFAGPRVGVRGSATGGGTNWAGYFEGGDVYITNELRVGSGALGGAAGYKVSIDGKLIAEEVRVQLSQDWPDYVFQHDYPLLPLNEVDHFIKINGHLPGMPSAAQVESEGHHIGEIQLKLLEKIEELTIHLIQLQKQNDQLMKRVNDLENSSKTTDQ